MTHPPATPGLHHVTAIAGWPQDIVDFMTKVLGQHLVKRTVNFDTPDTYHLYFGNSAGDPGTILTFFPFVDAGRGNTGPGMPSAVAYRVGAFDEWMGELALDARDFGGPFERFGARVLSLETPDGGLIEFIESPGSSSTTPAGFHSVTRWLDEIGPTHALLTELFGFEEVGYEASGGEERTRLRAPGHGFGNTIDLMRRNGVGISEAGAGTIDHIAFRATSNEMQLEIRERLLLRGLEPTEVINRQYFNAVYVREPGGVLFEIATDPPGFAVDEPAASLGETLKLPPDLEPSRNRLERVLPDIRLHAPR